MHDILFLDQELISYRWSWSSCCCYRSCSCWGDLCKKAKAPSFEIESGWNLATRIDWRSQIFDLTSYFPNGVISHSKLSAANCWRDTQRLPPSVYTAATVSIVQFCTCWIRKRSHITYLLFRWGNAFQKRRTPNYASSVISNWIWVKFGRIVNL